MDAHTKWDFLYYLAFLAGEFFFLLKKGDLAAASLADPANTISAFIWRNRVRIAVRWAFLWIAVYYPIEHYGAQKIFSLMGWNFPLTITPGAVPFFALGYMSDSLMDWAQEKPWMPAFFKNIIPQSNYQAMMVPCESVDECKYLGGKKV